MLTQSAQQVVSGAAEDRCALSLLCHNITFCGVQYLEEPVADIRDLAAFAEQTQIPIALDETLDQLFAGQGIAASSPSQRHEHVLHSFVSQLPAGAVAALVVKPGVIGGFERAVQLQQWARTQDIQVSYAL